LGVSENFSQNRRGRPRKVPETWLASMRDLFPDLTTERSLNNKWHLTQAFRALGRSQEECYQYLIDRGERERMRTTILTALGRLGDQCESEREAEVWIRETADHICRERMKTSDALEHIRDMRELQRMDFP
jgi:hypothetical protein